MKYLLLLYLFSIQMTWSSPAEDPREISIAILDSAQNVLTVRINSLANQLDSFFATERADDELGRSSVRVRTTYEIRERASPGLATRYRINLKLPHLEEKFKYGYYLDQDAEKDGLTEEEAKERSEKDRVRTGWLFNADAGVNAAIPPKIVTRARLRKSIPTGRFVHRFTEQVTYTTDESGLVEETSWDTDRTITENILFRFVNSKTWRIFAKEFSTAHGPTFPHQVTDNDALLYRFIMSTVVNEGIWFIDNYRLSFTYRRNLYNNWIYFDIEPGLDFPKTWSFRRTPFIGFQLEALFGG